jgi:hypothetical protein
MTTAPLTINESPGGAAHDSRASISNRAMPPLSRENATCPAYKTR